MHVRVWFSLLFVWAASPAWGQVLMTEIMADNAVHLKDEDAEFPDWIELFNAGAQEVDLEGHYLTDDAEALDKWAFPAVKLGPKRFLVVFCSGKDRRDPARELHANFRLEELGEGVALVAPDKRTIITGHDSYPEQVSDASYGLAMESNAAKLLAPAAPARILVPAAGDLELRWTEPDFDDAAWRQGTTAVGFGVRSPELELIGTDVGAEMLNVNASVYIRIPFQVPDPAAVDILTLKMRYDDGFVAFLNGQPVASSNAPEVLAWNSPARRNHVAGTVEQFDISAQVAILKPGTNVLAIQGLNVTAGNADVFILPELDSLDIGSVNPDASLYFPKPTPGGPNGPGLAEAAAKPQLSLAGGSYVGGRQVEITTNVPGGVIRYTLDGTLPTDQSTAYAGPVNIAGPTRLTARVFKDGLLPGLLARATYIILGQDVVDFSSKVPLVLVTTFARAIGSNCGGGPYTAGHITIISPGVDGVAFLVDEPQFAHLGAFRRRGSSTCGNAKFSFNVEIHDDEGRDENVQIFDLPIESDYLMYAPNNFDRSLIRNPVAYFISREVGRYAARTRNVECFYHSGPGPVGMRNYFGVFNFMEKMKQHPLKIDVEQISIRDNVAPEVTGGYVLRRDRVGPDEIAITAGGYGSLVFVYPKVPTVAQRAYMTQTMNEVIGSLNPGIGSQAANPRLDFMQWIDHHIVNWYTKNVDAFRLSGYFHKDRNGPVVMGPVWDFDRTMGCSDDDRARDPEGWDNLLSSGDGGTRYFEAGGLGSWYSILFRNRPPIDDTPWNRAYRDRWRELRRQGLRTETILRQIDAWAEELREAADRDAAKWPGNRPRFGGFQGEITHLKNWLSRRADWIDAQFIEKPRFSPEAGLVARGTQVQLLLTAAATLYYTLDGTDPRNPAGQPAVTAVRYESPIAINQNTRIIARAFYSDGAWSAQSEGKFVVEIPALTITEIMYNPLPPTPEEDPGGEFSALRLEFVEVTNVGSQPVALAGMRFTKGITFAFDGQQVASLEPGQSVVIPRDTRALAARYGAGILVAGQFAGALTDAGEAIALTGAFDETVFDFAFRGDWHPETNGAGYSLINVDPPAPADTLGTPARWRRSDAVHGSPGRVESLPTGGLQLPGDAVADGKLNVLDAIQTLRLRLAGARNGPCGDGGLETAGNMTILDWDGNGTVNVTDAIGSVLYLFQDGPAPAAGTQCKSIPACVDACGR